MTVLIVDNYDSFTHNLAQALMSLTGEWPLVFRNDAITLDEVVSIDPTHIVLSPGPGDPSNPARFGIGHAIVHTLGSTTPILGVCLGHQGIASAFGGRIARAPSAMHGKTSWIRHTKRGLFCSFESDFLAMRYHSLVADPTTLPACLIVDAWSDDGCIMAVRHQGYPIFGVQFHPESIGTPLGPVLLERFLEAPRR